MHPDAEAFIRAMSDHPKDDAYRRAFADWLQEHPDQIVEVLRFYVRLLWMNGYRTRFAGEPPPLPFAASEEVKWRWVAALGNWVESV